MALILATLLKLEMRQIDSIQAFPQANTSEDVYMQIPAGWGYTDEHGNNDYIIKLKKTFMVQQQAPETGIRNELLA